MEPSEGDEKYISSSSKRFLVLCPKFFVYILQMFTVLLLLLLHEGANCKWTDVLLVDATFAINGSIISTTAIRRFRTSVQSQ